MEKITDYGKLRANPNARADNNLKLAKCDAADSCLDQGIFDTASEENITGFVYNGVTITLPSPVGQEDYAAVEAAIEAALADYEFDIFVSYKDVDGTTAEFQHVGEGTISALVGSDENKSLTRYCNIYAEQDYSVTIAEGAIANLSVNGNTEVMPNTPYAVATDAAQLQTDVAAELEDALTAAGLEPTVRDVKVVVSGSNFVITFKAVANATIVIGGEDVAAGHVRSNFLLSNA